MTCLYIFFLLYYFLGNDLVVFIVTVTVLLRVIRIDDIHEYLLLKGVEAASIHGGKEQEERNEAIKDYKAGKKDVLVATDVAAKGLGTSHIIVSILFLT